MTINESIQQIINAVEETWCLPGGELINNRSRKPSISEPRGVAMVLIRNILRLSTTQVGEIFGKDHGTVLHWEKRITDICAYDSNFKNRIDEVNKRAISRSENLMEKLDLIMEKIDFLIKSFDNRLTK